MFKPDGIEKRYESIRALCQKATQDEIPNDTIDLPPYSGKAVRKINKKLPNYAGLNAIDRQDVDLAYMHFVAHYLCRFYMKTLSIRETDNKSEWERDKVDWDKIAEDLKTEAEDLLDPFAVEEIEVDSPLILAPHEVYPATETSQSIVQESVVL